MFEVKCSVNILLLPWLEEDLIWKSVRTVGWTGLHLTIKDIKGKVKKTKGRMEPDCEEPSE